MKQTLSECPDIIYTDIIVNASKKLRITAYFTRVRRQLFLAVDRFELEKFSAYIGLSFNIFVCFVIPIIVFIIGKIRRII